MIRPYHLLEYALVRAALAAVLSLGITGAIGTARGVGDLIYRFDGRHRRRALRNLARAFPELPGERREEIARSAFRSFVQTVVEAAYIPRLFRRSTVDRHLEVEWHPEARAALDSGRGAIVCTAHIGNWEVCGAAMGFLGYPLTSVARRIENPLLDRFVIATRERFGQRIIMKTGAPREMARTLKRGGNLAVLVDQNTGRRGIFVSFFGRPASTTPAPATLAVRRGVPLLPMWSRRIGDGFRIRIHADPPVLPPAGGDREENVRRLTQEITARVEAWVREEPGQWLWGHRRWKTKPAAEAEESPECRPSPSTSGESRPGPSTAAIPS